MLNRASSIISRGFFVSCDMPSNEQILNKYAAKWTEKIKQSLISNNRRATGKTVDSVHYQITKEGFEIKGAKHIDNLISGRGSSKSSGGSGWYEQLREWVIARGIPEKATYAIYRSINENGWKTPPSPNLIDQAVTQYDIDDLKSELAKNELSLIRAEIKKAIR